MTVITRKCLEPGCRCQVSPPHLMCVSHRQALPSHIRRGTQERLRGWQSKDMAIVYLRSHIEAAAAASRAVSQ